MISLLLFHDDFVFMTFSLNWEDYKIHIRQLTLQYLTVHMIHSINLVESDHLPDDYRGG